MTGFGFEPCRICPPLISANPECIVFQSEQPCTMGKVKSRRQKYHASAARLKKNDANRIAESADSDMKEEQDVMQSDKVMKIIIYNFCYITTDLLIATDVVYV